MVEVTLQIPPSLSESIKKIADKQFEGDLTAVLNEALEFYIDNQRQKREQLKKVVQQIRQEIEAQGGLDEKDLERRIREYRRSKHSKPQ